MSYSLQYNGYVSYGLGEWMVIITNDTWWKDDEFVDEWMYPSCDNTNSSAPFYGIVTNTLLIYDFSSCPCSCDGPEDESYFIYATNVTGYSQFSTPSIIPNNNIKIGAFNRMGGTYSGENVSGDYFDLQDIETTAIPIAETQPPADWDNWVDDAFTYEDECHYTLDDYTSDCTYSETYEHTTYFSPSWELSANGLLKLVKWNFLYSD